MHQSGAKESKAEQNLNSAKLRICKAREILGYDVYSITDEELEAIINALTHLSKKLLDDFYIE